MRLKFKMDATVGKEKLYTLYTENYNSVNIISLELPEAMADVGQVHWESQAFKSREVAPGSLLEHLPCSSPPLSPLPCRVPPNLGLFTRG